MGPVGAEAGPALNPSERSSGPARIAVEEDVPTAQSAKAPESDVSCLLVVATTAAMLDTISLS